MRRIDELHLDHPFAGSRMLRGILMAEGHEVGRLHVATLMKTMGIEALYRRPRLEVSSGTGGSSSGSSARCRAGGNSGSKPFCDGTYKRFDFEAR